MKMHLCADWKTLKIIFILLMTRNRLHKNSFYFVCLDLLEVGCVTGGCYTIINEHLLTEDHRNYREPDIFGTYYISEFQCKTIFIFFTYTLMRVSVTNLGETQWQLLSFQQVCLREKMQWANCKFATTPKFEVFMNFMMYMKFKLCKYLIF